MRYLLATNSTERSEILCEYLASRVDDSDLVYAVNSKRGGDRTNQRELDAGRDAIDAVDDRLSRATNVETHQLVRGNAPAEDLLKFAASYDADEIVMGIRKRSATGKIVFGSVASDLLMNSPIPMRVVPVDRAR